MGLFVWGGRVGILICCQEFLLLLEIVLGRLDWSKDARSGICLAGFEHCMVSAALHI